jgi:hypothetical protein
MQHLTPNSLQLMRSSCSTWHTSFVQEANQVGQTEQFGNVHKHALFFLQEVNKNSKLTAT